MPSTTTTAIFTLAAAMASTAYAQTAYVVNACSFPVYMNTAGGQGAPAGESFVLQPGEGWSQPIQGLGNAVMAAKSAGASSETQLSYSLSDHTYYALGDSSGSFTAFAQDGVSIVPSVSTCPSIVCPAGTTTCDINDTKACDNTDLTYTLCVA